MNTILFFIVILIIGLTITLILFFLSTGFSTVDTSENEGVSTRIQAFIDEVVQQIRDSRVTDKVREFWKNAERTFNDWLSEIGLREPKEPQETQHSSFPLTIEKDIPKTRQTTIPHKMKCFTCGASFSGGNFCPNCGKEHRTCPICRKPILYGENVVECPMCGILAHTPHLLEWLRVKGICPNCKSKLTLN
ncbi:MAG: RING finger domain-containing protein [Candidatus Heimdallarchaeota archaeon]